MKSLAWVLLGVSLVAAGAGVHAQPSAPERSACKICQVRVQAGMSRADVEQAVAAASDRPNTYSPYGNNLRGGVVEYREAAWLLRVVYAAGAPAPWVIGTSGAAQHLLPLDEKVLSHEIVHAPQPRVKS